MDSGYNRVVVFGGLKVGTRLWVWPPGERAQTEVQATCVLDFYVHESIQRHGVGRQLFEATVAVRPLTSKRSRGRQSRVAKQDPTAGLLWAGMLPPQAAPASGISSRMGSFSQPRRVGDWPDGMGSTGSTAAAVGQQSWLQGSPAMPFQGDPDDRDSIEPSSYQDVRSSWQQREMDERSIAARRAGAQGPAPITRHHGTLPPLTKRTTGMKHFTEADNDTVSAWMSETGRPVDHRPQTKISPLGKAQRSGANAGQCLRW
ncbi:hypothetical protein N2152v2_002818 [Parachlorella kessleri]